MWLYLSRLLGGSVIGHNLKKKINICFPPPPYFCCWTLINFERFVNEDCVTLEILYKLLHTLGLLSIFFFFSFSFSIKLLLKTKHSCHISRLRTLCVYWWTVLVPRNSEHFKTLFPKFSPFIFVNIFHMEDAFLTGCWIKIHNTHQVPFNLNWKNFISFQSGNVVFPKCIMAVLGSFGASQIRNTQLIYSKYFYRNNRSSRNQFFSLVVV